MIHIKNKEDCYYYTMWIVNNLITLTTEIPYGEELGNIKLKTSNLVAVIDECDAKFDNAVLGIPELDEMMKYLSNLFLSSNNNVSSAISVEQSDKLKNLLLGGFAGIQRAALLYSQAQYHYEVDSNDSHLTGEISENLIL
jgi:hypothetical protein